MFKIRGWKFFKKYYNFLWKKKLYYLQSYLKHEKSKNSMKNCKFLWQTYINLLKQKAKNPYVVMQIFSKKPYVYTWINSTLSVEWLLLENNMLSYKPWKVKYVIGWPQRTRDVRLKCDTSVSHWKKGELWKKRGKYVN